MLRRVLWRMRRSAHPAPQDLVNMVRYRRNGPIAHERIWIDPRKIRRVVRPHPAELGMMPDNPDFEDKLRKHNSTKGLAGRVIRDEIDTFELFPLAFLPKVRACRRHWLEGLSWEEAGAISALMFKITTTGSTQSGCRTREDVVRRYERLDEIFESVRAEGRLTGRTRRQACFRRDLDGVQIHLGRDGELLFGATGTHRLAMALVLGFERIPASLGFVHESALDLLPGLRRAARGAALADGSAGAGKLFEGSDAGARSRLGKGSSSSGSGASDRLVVGADRGLGADQGVEIGEDRAHFGL